MTREEIFEFAKKCYAMSQEYMMTQGAVPPMVAVIKEGMAAVIPADFGDDLEKENFAQKLNIIAKSENPEALIHVSETWSIERLPGEIKKYERPSEAPDAREGVLVYVRLKDGYMYGLRGWKKIITKDQAILEDYEVSEVTQSNLIRAW
jgi:hypothetical protein